LCPLTLPAARPILGNLTLAWPTQTRDQVRVGDPGTTTNTVDGDLHVLFLSRQALGPPGGELAEGEDGQIPEGDHGQDDQGDGEQSVLHGQSLGRFSLGSQIGCPQGINRCWDSMAG
jgi:hypothetical protein